MELTFTLDQIDEAALQFWQQAGQARVFAFHAPMGTGKTSFIIALCRALGAVTPGSSPSFALVNEYQLANGDPVYHADLYRIGSEAEAREAGTIVEDDGEGFQKVVDFLAELKVI